MDVKQQSINQLVIQILPLYNYFGVLCCQAYITCRFCLPLVESSFFIVWILHYFLLHDMTAESKAHVKEQRKFGCQIKLYP